MEDKEKSFEEQLYDLFVQMRKRGNIMCDLRYDEFDVCLNSQAFKNGFLMGVKIATMVLKDINGDPDN